MNPRIRVAAYQVSLAATASIDGMVELVREQVSKCAAQEVEFLCCPEGLLGGLADYNPGVTSFNVSSGDLDPIVVKIPTDSVTTILGFTEIDDLGDLYNSAAILHRGMLAGVYRKMNPAINQSVYKPGADTPVFQLRGLKFGIAICYDSTFAEPISRLAAKGATTVFVPTNNGLPAERDMSGLRAEVRAVDTARARENGVFVVRADICGHSKGRVGHGSSEIVDPNGRVLCFAEPDRAELLVAEIDRAGQGRSDVV
jgi:predicted amidohydrolase